MKPALLPLMRLGILAFGYLYATSEITNAQVTPDNTVNTQVNQTDNVSEITGGETRGNNLFHSFQEFSVRTGNEAFFNNAAAIKNIFSRVTGGNVSKIDGLIRANNASLFLINPAGIIFGEGASLDIGGSFYGSSADSILFEDGEFSATDLDNPPVLTINAPIGLGFRDNPEDIANKSRALDSTGQAISGLQVQPEKNLALVGGNVSLDGGVIVASGGRVELGGLTAAGTISFNNDGSLSFPDGIGRGNVSFNQGAFVGLSGTEGGNLTVNANNLEISENSLLQAGTFASTGMADGQSGDIILNATGAIKIDGSTIDNVVEIGNAGNVQVEADSLALANAAKIDSGTLGNGDGGDLVINVKNLRTNNSNISTSTNGEGNAGSLTVNASESIELTGDVRDQNDNGVSPGGLLAQVDFGGKGKGGSLTVETKRLSISNGSKIQAATFDNGDAGELKIRASEIDVFNTPDANNTFPTEINAGNVRDVLGRNANLPLKGNGGNLTIETERLKIRNGALVRADTDGKGNAGNLSIKASDLVEVTDDSSFLTANVNTGAEGQGGNLTIDTKRLNVTNGGQVGASTFGIGNAGNLTVNASESVELSGENPYGPGGLFAQVDIEGQGNGGNLTIDTKRLSVSDGSKIQVSTFGEGDSGDLTIRASDIDVFETPSNNFFSTGIFAETSLAKSPNSSGILSTGQGNAGNLTIETERLRIKNGGQVSVSTFGLGNAGTLTVKASDSIEVSGIEDAKAFGGSRGGSRSESFLASEVKQGATGRGGSIKIETGDLKVANEARISVSSLDESGTAGNLDIIADSIQLDKGTITAATALGEGGNIDLNIDDTLTLRNNSSISAQARNNASGGNIDIDAGFVIAFPSQSESNGNDIVAKAEQGKGGDIRINRESVLLGIEERKSTPLNQTNDIDASSEVTGLGGNISIPRRIDPVRGATELPKTPVEPEQTTEQACSVNQETGKTNGLTVKGKGGVPPAPDLPLNSQTITVNGQDTATQTNQAQYPEIKPIPTSYGDIIPAQGVVVTKDGRVILTAYRTDSNSRVPQASANCGK
jgi:filamentous hemagglutinin family protein